MSTSTPVARPSRRQRKPRSDLKLGLAFILPATIGLVAFYIWPLIRGIWLSFTEYNLLTPEEFTGLDNYKRMAQDDTFWNAVVVTVEYVVINIGLQTVLALLIAVLMQRLTQSTFVRSIVLTPYLVSNVVAAMLWLWILDNTLGVTNQLLESLTGSKTDFFSSSLAIPTIAIINVWRHVGYTAHPTSLLPVDINLRGFARVFGMQSTEEALADGGSGAAINFWLYLRNSVIISTLVTVGQVFFSAMAAYSFSRLRWKGRDTVFAVFLGALMVPSIFTLLPNFVLVKQLHLIDTFLGVALPTMFMTPFAVFFLKQFFMNIPRELEEAALLDGASKIRVFFTLILPMAKAPISTLAILTYITAWNDYFWPLLVSYTDSSRVLTVALAVFRSQAPQTGPDWAGLMAATLVAALPMLLLFMAFARRIVNSIGFTGIK